MRLFLFPISHRHTLIYAQRINRQLTSEITYIEKITNKTSAKWVEWEAAEKGWQKKVTEWGNSAFARIPYQEWGLKSVPPLSARRKTDELQGKESISVRFPPNILKPASVLDLLRKLATERQALHRKSMWWSIAGLPIALPFGLLPVIPNLPFFYLTFRAWSHWRALNGSKHIEFLLEQNLIKLAPSDVLEKVYDLRSVPDKELQALKEIPAADVGDPAREKAVIGILDSSPKAQVEPVHPPPGNSDQDIVFLAKGSGKLVSRAIGVKGLDIEVERALAQVERLIKKDQKLAEEKKKEDASNASDAQKKH